MIARILLVVIVVLGFLGSQAHAQYLDSRCAADAFFNDPCCQSDRPEWCPAEPPGNPWKIYERRVEDNISDYLENAGLPNNWAANHIYDQIADKTAEYIVGLGKDFIDRLNGASPPEPQLTLSTYLALMRGRERLTVLIVASVASIANVPSGASLSKDTIYPIPYKAGPGIRDACQHLSSIHKDRRFRFGLMNTVSSSGNLIFQTNVGVPTEIHAKRPSGTTRWLRKHKWMWWFGDGNMLPLSKEDRSGTNHVYRVEGNYVLNFVMLESALNWYLGFSSNTLDDLSWRDIDVKIDINGNDLSPDACNYGEMRVLPNDAPYARATVGPDFNYPGRYRFSALASSDPNGNPLSYHWTFHDGTTASGAVAYKSYPEMMFGSSHVTLTVSDGGLSDTTVRSFDIVPTCGGPTGRMCL